MVARLLFCAAAASGLTVLAIFGFLLWFSLPIFKGDMFMSLFSWHWQPMDGAFGILPMVAGSLFLAFSAMLLAFPAAVGLCGFIHGIGPARLAKPLLGIIRFMTSIPTVVYGLVSVFLLVPLLRSGFSGSGFSWLAASTTLSLLVLPTIVLILDNQFRQLHEELHIGAMALGLSPAQQFLHLVLPLSRYGLLMALVLGFGRAIGDTMISLMLAGNAPQLPHSLLDSIRTLTAHIALVVSTDSQGMAYASLFACGLMLFGVSLLVNVGLYRLRRSRNMKESALSGAFRFFKMIVTASWLSTGSVLAALTVLLVFLFWKSVPGWSVALFFGDTPAFDALFHGAPVFDGLWPACVGTLMLVLLSMAIAIPLGLATGVYLAEYTQGRFREWVSFCVDVLASVPSVLVGLFGFALILFLRKTFAPQANTGLLLSALCIAVLILPYLINTARLSLAGLPQTLRLTGASLGLSRNRIVWRILFPASLPGIFSGIILAIGRAAEDTAVILLTGAVVNAGAPSSLTGKYEALPFHIYYLAAEHQSPQELTQAFGAAVVLLCLTGLMFGCARWLQRRLERQWKTGGTA